VLSCDHSLCSTDTSIPTLEPPKENIEALPESILGMFQEKKAALMDAFYLS